VRNTNDLAAGAERIAEADDLGARLNYDRSDELGTLARAFDNMVERLAQTRRELVDRSFESGAAENASGVLHNLGNAMKDRGQLDGAIAAYASYLNRRSGSYMRLEASAGSAFDADAAFSAAWPGATRELSSRSDFPDLNAALPNPKSKSSSLARGTCRFLTTQLESRKNLRADSKSMRRVA
jgi:hypothetical protein